jgi:F-type H+-transporting ATPase subunit b
LELLKVGQHYRRARAILVGVVFVLASWPAVAAAQPAPAESAAPSPAAESAPQPPQAEPPASPPDPGTHEVAPGTDAAHQEASHSEDADHGSGWLAVVAKIFNFAVLVGILTYFLKTPLTEYLTSRGEAIRRDLVEARTLRQSAESQLQSVRTQLAGLPAELEALTARGRDELAHEQVRLKETTAREREKLVERTRREIDLQTRMARRQLVEHTADLAIGLARARIEQQITPDDQTRLIDRYAAEVRS